MTKSWVPMSLRAARRKGEGAEDGQARRADGWAPPRPSGAARAGAYSFLKETPLKKVALTTTARRATSQPAVPMKPMNCFENCGTSSYLGARGEVSRSVFSSSNGR